MKPLSLCLAGLSLLACAKEVVKPPTSEPNRAILPPDTKVANLSTVGADPDPDEWVLSTPDSVVAPSVRDTTGEPMEWSDSLDAVEHDSIAASGGRVFRAIYGEVKYSELRINLLSGRTAVFKPDSTTATYRYAGYLSAIHSYIVHRVPAEDAGNYLIVDDSTGDTTTVWAVPVPSPDGKRFVLTSLGEDASSDIGNISIWQMVGRKPQKEFSLDDERWASSDAVWRDSVTVDFTKNTSKDQNNPFTYIKTPGRLTRTGTTSFPAANPKGSTLTPLSDGITRIASGRIDKTYQVFDYLRNGVEFASIVREIGMKPSGQPLLGVVKTVVLPPMDSTDHLRFSGTCGRGYNSDERVLAVVSTGGDSTYRNAKKAWRFDPQLQTLREIPAKGVVCYNKEGQN